LVVRSVHVPRKDGFFYWLVKNHRDLIEAEFAINEGGGGTLRGGKYLWKRLEIY